MNQMISLDLLRVGDHLVDYDVVMIERGYAYPPGFSGSVNAAGLWVDGVSPHLVTRLRFSDPAGRAVYLFPQRRELVRCGDMFGVISVTKLTGQVNVSRGLPVGRGGLTGIVMG